MALPRRSKAGVGEEESPKAAPHNTALNPFWELKVHDQREIILSVVRRWEGQSRSLLLVTRKPCNHGERLRSEECRVVCRASLQEKFR